ncbi:MAG TPA: creatininase family protein [Thermoanaerobaculia bacterium]
MIVVLWTLVSWLAAAPPATAGATPHVAPAKGGVLLEDLTWVEAEKRLTPDAVVVIPLGAGSKEHGPHLRLKNDFVLAEYLKRRVLTKARVVIAPTVNYSFYPAFLEYPGSTSLRLETARDLFVDVCRGLSRFGPRRFYVLNTGVSTVRALEPAAAILASDGILLRYTDVLECLEPIEKRVCRQEGGTHADEAETSMMLYMSPADVDMRKAVKDYHPGERGLTRDPKKEGFTYSPSGVYGDATLATREKGKRITEALVAAILEEIEALRAAEPPPAPPAAPRLPVS